MTDLPVFDDRRRHHDHGTVDVYPMFVGGEWVSSSTGETFDSIDPYVGRTWARHQVASGADVDRAVAVARSTFENEWRHTTGAHRATLMRRLADLVGQHTEELAAVDAVDNGKLLREMRGQAESLPSYYRYFAGLAETARGTSIQPENDGYLVYTRNEPVGVVAAVTAWNSPLLLLTWKLAPALAAGCTLVVKPSEHATASTVRFARLVRDAGFPAGTFQVVTGRGDVGRALAAHPGVGKVAFTGSTSTGVDVLKTAADNLARVSLELGGKSPNIVFADADLDAAVNGAVSGIFAAGGQTCMAGSRVLVEESVADEVTAALARRAESLMLGDPLDDATQLGPLAFGEQRDKVMGYIAAGTEDGARLVTGGACPSDPRLAPGLFVEPTVFSGVRNDSRIAQEEIFGPVASVIGFTDEADAVAKANDTRYGLAAGIWTSDVRRAHRVAARLDAGTVWVNAYRAVSPSVPLGGFGHSGIGRENGHEALSEYTEAKAVWLELTGESRDPFRLG